MRKRSAEEKQKQLERFLMNVAEAADAAKAGEAFLSGGAA